MTGAGGDRVGAHTRGTSGTSGTSEGPAARSRRMGAAGEARAAAWYEAHGYQVLDRNWRCGRGELDLVCRRGPLVVVVEVKTRTTGRYGTGVEAVGPSKQRRLRRLAACWLRHRGVRCTHVRFDVVSIDGGQLRVWPSAF